MTKPGGASNTNPAFNPNRGRSIMAKAPLHYLDDAKQRFWSMVAPDTGGCRPWLGKQWRRGYGRFNAGDSTYRANRVALYYSTGIMPDDLGALHSCHNPVCCNPEHLRWGTHIENQRDKSEAGTIRGAGNPRAKLTADQVDAIRADPRPTAELLTVYGVTKSTINKIRRGASW